MKKIVWLLMMVVMPMVANAAFSRNADMKDEDELLHRLDQYIARRDEFSSKKEKKLIRMKKKLNLTLFYFWQCCINVGLLPGCLPLFFWRRTW